MTEPRAAPFSSLTPGIALFCGALLFSAVLLHRLLGMQTQVALNLFAIAFAGAVLALALGCIALMHVWRNGTSGGAYVVIGMVLALGMLGWPAAYIPAYLYQPRVNDIATDLADPPAFAKLAKVREAAGSGSAFARARLEAVPADTYADLKPLVIKRPVEETFDIVLDAVKRMRFEIVGEEPPNRTRAGTIEAVDRTMVIGFYDDVAIRVAGTSQHSRIDVRSASRYGAHDFGRNASRMRRILTELKSRIDATIPGSGGQRVAMAGGKRLAMPKRLKDGKKTLAGRRSAQDRARSDAQRGPGQRARQR